MADRMIKTIAHVPRGFVDRTSLELHAVDKKMSVIRNVCKLYGFENVETSIFEYTAALGNIFPDQGVR